MLYNRKEKKKAALIQYITRWVDTCRGERSHLNAPSVLFRKNLSCGKILRKIYSFFLSLYARVIEILYIAT